MKPKPQCRRWAKGATQQLAAAGHLLGVVQWGSGILIANTISAVHSSIANHWLLELVHFSFNQSLVPLVILTSGLRRTNQSTRLFHAPTTPHVRVRCSGGWKTIYVTARNGQGIMGKVSLDVVTLYLKAVNVVFTIICYGNHYEITSNEIKIPGEPPSVQPVFAPVPTSKQHSSSRDGAVAHSGALAIQGSHSHAHVTSSTVGATQYHHVDECINLKLDSAAKWLHSVAVSLEIREA